MTDPWQDEGTVPTVAERLGRAIGIGLGILFVVAVLIVVLMLFYAFLMWLGGVLFVSNG